MKTEFSEIFIKNEQNLEAQAEQKEKLENYIKERLAGTLSLVSARKSYAVTRYAFTGETKYVSQYSGEVEPKRRKRIESEIAITLDKDDVYVSRSRSKLIVEVPNEEPHTFHYGDAIDIIEEISTDVLGAYFGEFVSGEPAILDFYTWRYLLIGGIQGSGKSVCIHNILLSLFYKYTSSDIEVYLIDNIKKSELIRYKGIDCVKETIDTTEDTIPLLKSIYEEITKRGDILRERGDYQKLEDLNADFPDSKLPYIFLVIEEIDTLLDGITLGRETEEARRLLIALAKTGRYAGLHLIITSQKPSAKNIGTDLRSMMDARISLKMASTTDSKFVLETSTEAARLKGKGDAFFKDENDIKRLQVSMLSHEELVNAVKWLKENR